MTVGELKQALKHVGDGVEIVIGDLGEYGFETSFPLVDIEKGFVNPNNVFCRGGKKTYTTICLWSGADR